MSNVCPVCQSPVEPGVASCTVCGFRLQGNTCEFEPIAIDASLDVGATEGNEVQLRVVRGPQIGTIYPLRGTDITIGRDPQCTIFLNDMTVSRSHARLFLDKGCHVIMDDHSYNGVWVNNVNVDAKALKNGDFIQIGAFGFIYEEM